MPWSALPAATSLVSTWTWLYTVALPEQVRTARREEICSDLHDQLAQDREAGVSPARTAIHVIRRMASGAWDDVGWSLPHIPPALAGHLIRGSDAIGHVPPSPWAISSLAVLGLMNWVMAMSDRHPLGLNGSSSMQGYWQSPCFLWSDSTVILTVGVAILQHRALDCSSFQSITAW